MKAGYSYYMQQTNNLAEYCAAWLGLKVLAISQKKKASVEIIGDSYVVLQQMEHQQRQPQEHPCPHRESTTSTPTILSSRQKKKE
jgi:ribonuclease HI